MKKSLLAIAAMTAFAGAAHAQSSVSVYGIVDVGMAGVTNGTTTNGTTVNAKTRTTGSGSGPSTTTRIGFKGTEDLGGGMKANFVLEYGLGDVGTGANGSAGGTTTVDQNGGTSSFGARQSWVGISDSKMGELRLGRQESAVHGVVTNGMAGASNNMAGAAYSSSTTATVRPHLVYMNQTITYITPKVAGFQLKAMTASNSTAAGDQVGTTGVSQTSASIEFTGVKNLKALIGYQTANAVVNGTSNDKRITQALSANYDFGVAKVFGLAAENKATNQTTGASYGTSKVYELGVSAPVAKKINVFGSMLTGTRSGNDNAAMTNNSTSSFTGLGVGNADYSGFQLGSNYSFSKRTTAYAIYGNTSIKGTGLATNDKLAVSNYAVGLRHTF